MALYLLAPDFTVRSLDGADDRAIPSTAGPAVVLDSESPDAASSAGSGEPGASGSAPSVTDALAGRPHAYRESGGYWVEIGYEAADHWVQMTPQLRQRLLDDPLATLDVSEFKTATNGGSASIITNNWVYSGSPRVYRVAGQLREFVTVLGEIMTR